MRRNIVVITREEIKTIRDDLDKLGKYEKIILKWCPKALEQIKEETDEKEYV